MFVLQGKETSSRNVPLISLWAWLASPGKQYSDLRQIAPVIHEYEPPACACTSIQIVKVRLEGGIDVTGPEGEDW